MKTLITVTLLCVVLYAGISEIANATSTINHHNNQVNNAIALMEH